MGISLHKKTVASILKENGLTTPPMKYQPPTWEALLAENNQIWAMDFCNIIDLKLFQIYMFSIIDITTREIVWQAVTVHPNRNWIVQQFKNLSIDEINFPKYLIIDNDGLYGKWIDSVMKEYFDIKTLRITPGSPWQNGFIERYWKTLQEELIDRLHIQDETSIRHFCSKYQKYYNDIRPHQGILGQTPSKLKVENSKIKNLSSVRYEKIKHVHGLFTEFKLVA